MKLTAQVHIENGCYWAEVAELPGCFAAGSSIDELFASLGEGIKLCLAEPANQVSLREEAERLAADPSEVREVREVVGLLEQLAPDVP